MDAALRAILEGTATETGEGFFAALVQNLARALNTHGAWVTEYFAEKRTPPCAGVLDGWPLGQGLRGRHCRLALREGHRYRGLVHFPDRLLELYPDEPDVKAIGAVSYMGVPLLDMDGKILGHMAVIDRRPMPEEPRLYAIFQDFCRAGGGGTATPARRNRSPGTGREGRPATQQRDGCHYRIG